MGHVLENPLVRRCRDFTAEVAKGQTDGQHAAELIIEEAKAIANSLKPNWRWEYLSDAAVQVAAAGEAQQDDEIFVTVASWLREEALYGPT